MISNKNFIALLVFSFFIFSCKKDDGSTSEPVSNIHLDQGLLAYYPFSGNINDQSGHNLNGTIDGGSLTYDEHGYSNNAFNCNGNPDRIIVSNNGSLTFDSAFSISLNVMIRSTGRQNFIAIVDNETGKGPSFALGTNLPGNPNMNFGVPYSSNSCDSYSSDATTLNNTSSFQLQPESWYNIVCMFSSGISSIYINGDLVSAKTSTDNMAHVCPDSELIIGGWWKTDPTSLNGKIDEVRIYNRSLNAPEIAELAKNFD